MSKRDRPVFVAMLVSTLAAAYGGTYAESPDLRRQVEAGQLPPLERRLPAVPLIITPIERPGEFGGTWRMALVGYDQHSMLCRTLGYENLVRWDQNWTRVIPNVASSWTVNAEATVYRFQLRPGMRWSDGEPYTARDIVAWMDDVARDPQLNPVPPPWLAVNGRLPECSAPDATTVEFRFATPNVLFLEQLAGMRSAELTHYPAHHFQPVHRNHNRQGAARLAQRTGGVWATAFRQIYTPWTWRNAGVPTIDAWVINQAYATGVTGVVATRNPYYWKVDTRGRQLPYLDEVRFDVVADNQEVLRRAFAGEIDYQRQDISSANPGALAAVKAAEQSGRIATVRVIPTRSNPIVICLNLTHPDPQLRAVLGDKRVRIALSEAINRPALIRQIYGLEGKAWQVAPRPGSPLFSRRLGEQYTGYEPAQANLLLDQAGLPRREPGGLRYLADGRPFRVTILVPAPASTVWTRILEQTRLDWLAVGMTMEWKVVTQEEYWSLILKNAHDGAIVKGSGGYAAILEPEFFVPATFENIDQAFYAIPWARWFIDPRTPGAEPPPASVVKQMELFRQVLTEPERAARVGLMSRVLELAADEFYVMGICLEPDRFAIRTPGFRNVPASHYDSYLYPDPGPFNPCQFFLETGGTLGRN